MRLFAAYSPPLSVTRVRVSPRATSVTDTVAPPTTACDWSYTAPAIALLLACENSGGQIENRAIATSSNALVTLLLTSLSHRYTEETIRIPLIVRNEATTPYFRLHG